MNGCLRFIVVLTCYAASAQHNQNVTSQPISGEKYSVTWKSTAPLTQPLDSSDVDHSSASIPGAGVNTESYSTELLENNNSIIDDISIPSFPLPDESMRGEKMESDKIKAHPVLLDQTETQCFCPDNFRMVGVLCVKEDRRPMIHACPDEHLEGPNGTCWVVTSPFFTCPDGFLKSIDKCSRVQTTTENITCPLGAIRDVDNLCYRFTKGRIELICPDGFIKRGGACTSLVVTGARRLACPPGTVLEGRWCIGSTSSGGLKRSTKQLEGMKLILTDGNSLKIETTGPAVNARSFFRNTRNKKLSGDNMWDHVGGFSGMGKKGNNCIGNNCLQSIAKTPKKLSVITEAVRFGEVPIIWDSVFQPPAVEKPVRFPAFNLCDMIGRDLCGGNDVVPPIEFCHDSVVDGVCVVRHQVNETLGCAPGSERHCRNLNKTNCTCSTITLTDATPLCDEGEFWPELRRCRIQVQRIPFCPRGYEVIDENFCFFSESVPRECGFKRLYASPEIPEPVEKLPRIKTKKVKLKIEEPDEEPIVKVRTKNKVIKVVRDLPLPDSLYSNRLSKLPTKPNYLSKSPKLVQPLRTAKPGGDERAKFEDRKNAYYYKFHKNVEFNRLPESSEIIKPASHFANGFEQERDTQTKDLEDAEGEGWVFEVFENYVARKTR